MILVNRYVTILLFVALIYLVLRMTVFYGTPDNVAVLTARTFIWSLAGYICGNKFVPHTYTEKEPEKTAERENRRITILFIISFVCLLMVGFMDIVFLDERVNPNNLTYIRDLLFYCSSYLIGGHTRDSENKS